MSPDTGSASQKSGKPDAGKGRRPKHIPQRMCVVCRERSTKRTLTRVVRTAEGQVLVDPSGRLNGRGAYLCSKASCWDKAISGNVLGGALKTELTNEVRQLLRATSADYIAPESDEEQERIDTV